MNGAAPLDSVEQARSGAARPFYLQLWFLVTRRGQAIDLKDNSSIAERT